MAAAQAPSVLNVHTPTSSFAIVHSLTQETLLDLYNKLSRKPNTDYYGERVGPGWLKYEYNEAIWNLDDESDYTIFVWRLQQQHDRDERMSVAGGSEAGGPPLASTSRTLLPDPAPKIVPPPPSTMTESPTIHLRNPKKPLPSPPAYINPAYYIFQPSRAHPSQVNRSPAPSQASTSRRSKKGKKGFDDESEDDGVPKFKKQFEKFHAENGVRTVMGSIGPVQNVRMLLKAGYRHVYISRKFAAKHGFIPPDAAPGNYGYGGLVNIGSWPITLTPSSSQPGMLQVPSNSNDHQNPSTLADQSHAHHSRRAASPAPSHNLLSPPLTNGKTRSISGSVHKSKSKHNNTEHANPNANGHGPKTVTVDVYLSEEPHFDVVLGRSFIEKRQIKLTSIDPTDVVCLDTGEKIECELVILKDGRGEIVTVT
ncbi:hypothetical protein D9613_002644 [Agrocybe pediades]|uniref:Uncharacterized protein n=1 Tax=Agrocybe pediades TaxID=84607 RepID=A0A8H4QQQ8_9AGAR|nr:hypothetical protein D9613_002644 [Agrocybe pediades]